MSTTIRVDTATHAQLVALSRAMGASLTDTVHAAAESLRRELFAARVAVELETLQLDPDAWAEYLGEAESTVRDGIDR